jgi:hypothetical protein
MAISAGHVLTHIEDSAYLQAVAAALALKIVRTQDPFELQQDDAADVILAALVLAMRRGLLAQIEAAAVAMARTLGYGLLTPAQVDAIAEAQIGAAIDRAGPSLEAALADVKIRADLLASSGMGEAQIARVMATQGMGQAIRQKVEGVAKSMATSLVKSIEAATLLAAQEGKDQAAKKPLEWSWVTMLDDHVCEDVFLNSCQPRHGWHMPLDGWKKNGMPQGPQLICSVYSKSGVSQCRCFLTELGVFSGIEAGPVSAADAIQRGRARAVARKVA